MCAYVVKVGYIFLTITLMERSKMTLSNTCQTFMAHCQSVLNLSPHTLRAYEGDLSGFQKFFPDDPLISTLHKDSLRLYFRNARERYGYKDSSLRRKAACLKLMFRWAINERLLDHSPFEGLNEKFRLPKSLPRCIDSENAQKLRCALSMEGAEKPFSAMAYRVGVSILLETGIRVGELVKIDLNDISLSDQCIRIQGKGNRQRIVYFLSKATCIVTENYFSRREMVKSGCTRFLLNDSGSQITTQAVRKFLKKLVNDLGIASHITPHMLRHTCATQWLTDGLDIRHVQKLLGHHSISTTEIYTHVSDHGLKTALRRVNDRRWNDN